jgi:hypothetical protein
MITKRSRAPSPELAKAKKASEQKDMFKMTIYVPRDDVDKIDMIALKARESVSEVMRRVITDFLTKK